MSQPLPTSTTEQEFIGLVQMGLLERRMTQGVWSRLRYHRTCAACHKHFSGRSDFLQCRSGVGSCGGENWQFDSEMASKHVRIRGGGGEMSQLPVSTTEQEFIGLAKMGLLECWMPRGGSVGWHRLDSSRYRTCKVCRHYSKGWSMASRCRSCLTSDDDSGWQFDSEMASRHIRLLEVDTSANQQEVEK